MIRPWNKADDLAREDSDKPDKPDKLDAEGTRLAEEAEMIERACAAHQNPKALEAREEQYHEDSSKFLYLYDGEGSTRLRRVTKHNHINRWDWTVMKEWKVAMNASCKMY